MDCVVNYENGYQCLKLIPTNDRESDFIRHFDGPMDGAVYVLTKETEQEYLRSTNRKPDGVWFDGTDEHGRNVQHQYAFDKTIDQSIGAPINAYSVCLCYRYTGPVVDTGLTLETEEHVVGTREREPEISGNDIADEIEADEITCLQERLRIATKLYARALSVSIDEAADNINDAYLNSREIETSAT